jgi:hypothetical protein
MSELLVTAAARRQLTASSLSPQTCAGSADPSSSVGDLDAMAEAHNPVVEPALIEQLERGAQFARERRLASLPVS